MKITRLIITLIGCSGWFLFMIPNAQAMDCATAKTTLKTELAELTDDQINERLVAFSKAKVACPQDVNILYNFGVLQYQADAKADAQKTWQTVLKLQPQHKSAAKNLAIVAAELQSTEKSTVCATATNNMQAALELPNTQRLAELHEAQAACPSSINILYNLGLAQYQANAKAEAQKTWQAVLKQQPKHKSAAKNLAIVTTELKQLASSELLKPRITDLPTIDEQHKKPHAYALIIGISHYAHISKLHFATHDAENMREILLKRSVFTEGNITSLVDTDATYMNIRSEVNTLVRKAASHDDSTVLFYFSGHGSPLVIANGSTPDGFLLPVDIKAEDIANDTTLSVNWLQSKLATIPGPNVVSILDACFTGSGSRSVNSGKFASVQVNPIFLNTDGKAFAVAAQKMPAIEHPEGEQGAFSYFLMDALLGAASTQEGWIDLGTAFRYAQRKLTDIGSEQDPKLSGGEKIKLVLKP